MLRMTDDHMEVGWCPFFCGKVTELLCQQLANNPRFSIVLFYFPFPFNPSVC